MARVTRHETRLACFVRDARGAVYVEFLMAFMPVLLIFLSTIQIALLGAAQLVVRHAAWAGARSAVVMLHDDSGPFRRVPRGDLTEGDPSQVPSALDYVAFLGLPGASAAIERIASRPGGGSEQAGARMVPIRTAAYLPLLAFAPPADVMAGAPGNDVASSLAPELGARAALALVYTRSATVVSLHANAQTEVPARSFGKQDPVTVRVTYLAYCGVPIARALICDSLMSLVLKDGLEASDSESRPAVLRRRFENVEGRLGYAALFLTGARFAVFEAETTLPNQGADYRTEEEEP